MLSIKNLTAAYIKSKPILKGIDLEVPKGTTIGILGRNGSGKSTLAKAIFGLIPHIEGEIHLDGKPINGLPTHTLNRQGMGYFQQGGLVFPNLSTHENLVFAAGKLSTKELQQRTTELATYFELLTKPQRLKMKATYLSGGEKHQLALAMVLLQKPKFLILDEPSAGLSPANQKAMYEAIELLKENLNLSILLIEQNKEMAYIFADKLLHLQDGISSEHIKQIINN